MKLFFKTWTAASLFFVLVVAVYESGEWLWKHAPEWFLWIITNLLFSTIIAAVVYLNRDTTEDK